MPESPRSPIRPLTRTGIVWVVIVVVGVVTIVAALSAGRSALAITAMAFVGIGLPVAHWATRLRRNARGEPPSP